MTTQQLLDGEQLGKGTGPFSLCPQSPGQYQTHSHHTSLVCPGNGKDAEEARGNYDIKSTVEQEYLQIEENIAESTDTFMETVTIPPLIIPAETSPSVLVVELSNTNEVVIRQVYFLIL